MSVKAISSRYRLCLICLLGLGLRLWFSFVSDHVYYPDEIFQTAEPAFHRLTGYGIIPWDYLYGLRSYLIPQILAFLISTLQFLTGLDHHHFLISLRLLLSLASIVVVPAAYRLAQDLTRSRRFAYLCALTAAIWYELIYFAPRALTESLSVYLFALSYILPKTKFWHFWLFGFLLVTASLVRPQYFLISLVLAVYTLWHRSSKPLTGAVVGGLFSLFLFGLSDLSAYGQFLVHIPNNLKISWLSGLSALFGVKPFSFYFTSLLITSAGLILTAPAVLKHFRLKYLFWLYLAVLLLHSLIPHKEYRFIFVLIPLGLLLINFGLWKLMIYLSWQNSHALLITFGLISAISLFGMLGRLPYQSLVYPQPPLMRDGLFSLIKLIPASSPACSLYIPDRDWVYTGGYVYLNSPLPLFSHDYPPPEGHTPHYLILPAGLQPPASYVLLASGPAYTFYVGTVKNHHPGYNLYRQTGLCRPPESYSYYRSFPYLKAILDRFPPYL